MIENTSLSPSALETAKRTAGSAVPAAPAYSRRWASGNLGYHVGLPEVILGTRAQR